MGSYNGKTKINWLSFLELDKGILKMDRYRGTDQVGNVHQFIGSTVLF